MYYEFLSISLSLLIAPIIIMILALLYKSSKVLIINLLVFLVNLAVFYTIVSPELKVMNQLGHYLEFAAIISNMFIYIVINIYFIKTLRNQIFNYFKF